MRRRAVVAIAVMAVLVVAGCEQQKQAIVEDLPAARQQKARGDAQSIMGAVKMYQTLFGELPESVEALTREQTVKGVTGGPFLARVPEPPPGWSSYRLETRDDGTFRVSASGEGKTATAP
jgi:Type II secretion system (T2SS), protein G